MSQELMGSWQFLVPLETSLKSHLRSDPDIQDITIDVCTDILILASDGLWKVNLFMSTYFSFLVSMKL